MSDETHLTTKSDPSRRAINPLYQCFKTGSLTTYLIAYPAVTLLPFTKSDGVPDDPVAGTMAIYLSEGSAASQDIHIHGDQIYIWYGSTFSFPGKNLRIVARNIIGIKSSSATSSDILFDCKGVDGTPNLDPVPNNPGSTGTSLTSTYHPLEVEVVPPPPRYFGPPSYRWKSGGNWTYSGDTTSGGTGGEGGKGHDGQPGGSVRIYADLKAADDKAKGFLKVDVRGGAPSKGQQGGAGGSQGTYIYVNMDTYNSDLQKWGRDGSADKNPYIDYQPAFAYLPPNRPPHQGTGGKGGAAGAFGAMGIGATLYRDPAASAASGLVWVNVPRGREVAGGPGGPGDPSGEGGAKTLEPVPNAAVVEPPVDKAIKDAGHMHEPMHILMLIQRLSYEYDMLYSSKEYKKTDKLGIREQGFEATLDFVNTAVKDLQQAAKEADFVAKALVSEVVLSLTTLNKRKTSGSDPYGKSRTYIPDSSIDVANIDDELAALAVTEASLKDMSTKLEAQTSDRNQLRSTFNDTDTQIDDLNDKLNAWLAPESQEGSLACQLKAVKAVDAELEGLRNQLDGTLKSVWDQSKNAFSKECTGWQSVLGAVANVFMFAQPEISMAYKLGSLISIGSSISEIDTDSTKAAIKNEYIAKSIKNVDDALEGDAMKQNVELLNQDSVALKAQDSKYLALIAVQRSKFLSLCEQYFNDSKTPVDVQSAKTLFDSYLDKAQDRCEAILNYNRQVMAYDQTRLDYMIALKKEELLKSLNSQLTSDQTDLLYTFYSISVKAQKLRTLQTLHKGVRAYECAALKTSSVFDSLAELYSYDNIDQAVLQVAFNGAPNGQPGLSQDLFDFESSLKYSAPYDQRSFSYTAALNRISFNNFKTKGTLTILPDFKHKSLFAMEKSWFDIRLCNIEIYLIGAKGLDKQDTSKEKQEIDITMNMAKGFEVWTFDAHRKNKFEPKTFSVDREPTTLTYTYTKLGSRDIAKDYTTTKGKESYLTNFKYSAKSGDPARQYGFPLTSPFTKMDISVDTKYVDLTNLTEVMVVMSVRARTAPVNYEEPVITVHPATVPPRGTALMALPSPSTHNLPDLPRPSRDLGDHMDLAAFFMIPSLRTYLTHFSSTSLSATGVRNDRGNIGKALESLPSRSFASKKSVPIKIKEIQKIWTPYGDNAGKQALAIAAHTDRATAQKTYQAALDHLDSLVKLHDDPNASRDGLSYGDGTWDRDGHVAAGGGIIEIDDGHAQRIVSAGEGAYAIIGCFPNDITSFLDPYHSAQVLALKTGRERLSYVKTNFSKIKTAEKLMIKNKMDPTGCVVLLTNGAMIGVKNIYSWKKGTKTNFALEAITTAWHFVEGGAIWMGQHDSLKPGELRTLNYHVGQHVYRDMDVGNVKGLGALLGTMRETLPYRMESIDTGQNLELIVASKDFGLLLKRRVFNSVDCATAMLAEFRAASGPVVVFEDYPRLLDGLDLTAKNLADPNLKIATGEEPGIMEDGKRWICSDLVTMADASLAGTSTLNPVSEDQQKEAAAAVEDATRFSRTDSDVQDLRDKIMDVIEKYAQSEIKAAGNTTLSTSEVYERLKNSSDFNAEVKQIVRTALVDDSTQVAIANTLSQSPTFSGAADPLTDADYVKIVSDSAELHTVWNMTQPDGLVDIYIKTKVDDLLVKQQTQSPKDLNAIIAAQQDISTNLDPLIQSQEKVLSGMADNDPAIVKERQKLRELKEQAEEAEREKSNAEELQDLEKNADTKAAEHSTAEKKEQDHLFEKPNHDGGHEGGGGGEHILMLLVRNRPYNLVAGV